ncbi:MAG: mannose-1-phosphate guanylyltransferase [Candidatus Omnitrophota bacterium]
MPTQKVIAVILAGGGGTRLWPISTEALPKPVCSFSPDGLTMVQKTVERIRPLIPRERIFFITTRAVAAKIKLQLPDIPEGNYIFEPMTKDTAAAIGYAASVLQRRYPQAVMVVLPADHEISRERLFRQKLSAAIRLARTGPYLVTLGITPRGPSVEYGYIRTGKRLSVRGARWALEFKEKPNLKTARQFLKQGKYLWNSGMFVWEINTLRQAIAMYMPHLAKGLAEIESSWHLRKREKIIKKVFSGLDKISLDFGLMQKVKIDHPIGVAVIKSDFGWNDLGNWNALAIPADKDANVILKGSGLALYNTKQCVLCNRAQVRLVLIGLRELVVVNTEEATLVVPRQDASQVKLLVEGLKRSPLFKQYTQGIAAKAKITPPGLMKLIRARHSFCASRQGLIAAINISGLMIARFKDMVLVWHKLKSHPQGPLVSIRELIRMHTLLKP